MHKFSLHLIQNWKSFTKSCNLTAPNNIILYERTHNAPSPGNLSTQQTSVPLARAPSENESPGLPGPGKTSVMNGTDVTKGTSDTKETGVTLLPEPRVRTVIIASFPGGLV